VDRQAANGQLQVGVAEGRQLAQQPDQSPVKGVKHDQEDENAQGGGDARREGSRQVQVGGEAVTGHDQVDEQPEADDQHNKTDGRPQRAGAQHGNVAFTQDEVGPDARGGDHGQEAEEQGDDQAERDPDQNRVEVDTPGQADGEGLLPQVTGDVAEQHAKPGAQQAAEEAGEHRFRQHQQGDVQTLQAERLEDGDLQRTAVDRHHHRVDDPHAADHQPDQAEHQDETGDDVRYRRVVLQHLHG